MSSESQNYHETCQQSFALHFTKGGTTLDYSIIPESHPSNVGTTGSYYKLRYGPGEKVVLRTDLLCQPIISTNSCHLSSSDSCNSSNSCDFSDSKNLKYRKFSRYEDCNSYDSSCHVNTNRKKNRKALATFIQITDVHIIDASSPSRVSFLAQYLPYLPQISDAFRPYEILSCQVTECIMRKIKSIKNGPHLKQPIQFIVNCGDSSDSEQFNELQNVVNLMEPGREVIPSPTCTYVGVQDNHPAINYTSYYHPDCPPPGTSLDVYKIQYGYPNFPNILESAVKPFRATGTTLPWYIANGNHDATKLGNYSLGYYKILTLFDQLAIGEIPELGSKLIEAMAPAQAEMLVAALEAQDADAILKVINESVLRNVPATNKRRQFTRADFIRTMFNTTTKPNGHGLTERNILTDTLYYTFEISDEITGIVLDSCNVNGSIDDPSVAANGSFGRQQILWLEQELRKRHSMYYNEMNEKVYTNNKDKMIAIFCHHTIDTMNNITTVSTTFDNDPQKIGGNQFVQVLFRYPNIIFLNNGHLHLNRCLAYPNPSGRTQGFWEINTASHIDYPQESRIIEIADNCDGTLSIFCTIFDHLSPPDAERGCFPSGTNQNCSCTGVTGVVSNTGHTGTSQMEFSNNPRRKGCGCCSNNSYDTSNTSNSSEKCKETYSISEMASISRELSLNDPFIVANFGEALERFGKPEDRNVELIIHNPLWKDKNIKK